MPLTVHQFACLSDNYGFLIRDEASGFVATIDTPDADQILAEANQLGWQITHILNTHWHPDHAGGNAAIKATTGAVIVAPAEVAAIDLVDRVVGASDVVALGETVFEVIDAGGHTLQHIVYHSADARVVFVGDTLFPMGCGRIFEGTAEQMWASLSRIAALPPETIVYSAHEYAAGNASFALSITDDAAIVARAHDIFAMRGRDEATVPTTIATERASNPFLRLPTLEAAGDHVATFARVRTAKDVFKG